MKKIFTTLFLIILFLVSFNTKAQWVQTNGPFGGSVRCFAVSGSNVFAGTYGGVFLSTNNGASWTADGLTQKMVYSLLVNGTNIFAGTVNGGGIFLSTNNGNSWTTVNSGIPYPN